MRKLFVALISSALLSATAFAEDVKIELFLALRARSSR